MRWAASDSSAHFSAAVSYVPVGSVGPLAVEVGALKAAQPVDKLAIARAMKHVFMKAGFWRRRFRSA